MNENLNETLDRGRLLVHSPRPGASELLQDIWRSPKPWCRQLGWPVRVSGSPYDVHLGDVGLFDSSDDRSHRVFRKLCSVSTQLGSDGLLARAVFLVGRHWNMDSLKRIGPAGSIRYTEFTSLQISHSLSMVSFSLGLTQRAEPWLYDPAFMDQYCHPETECPSALNDGYSHVEAKWSCRFSETINAWEELRCMAPVVAKEHGVSVEDLILGGLVSINALSCLT